MRESTVSTLSSKKESGIFLSPRGIQSERSSAESIQSSKTSGKDKSSVNNALKRIEKNAVTICCTSDAKLHTISQSADHTVLAAYDKLNQVVFFSSEEMSEIARMTIPLSENGKTITLSPDGFQFATGQDSVSIWNAFNGEKILGSEKINDKISTITYSPDGRFIAAGSSEKNASGYYTIYLFEYDNSKPVIKFIGHVDPVIAISFDDDSALVSVDSNNTAIIWNIETGEELLSGSLEIGNSNQQSISAHIDTSEMVIYSVIDNQVFGWLIESGEVIHSYKPSFKISGFKLSSDAKRLVFAGEEGIEEWIIGEDYFLAYSSVGACNDLAFSHDGKIFFTTKDGKLLKIVE